MAFQGCWVSNRYCHNREDTVGTAQRSEGQKSAAFLPPTWCRPHSSVTGPAQQSIVHGLSQKGSLCSLSSTQQGHRVIPHPAGYSQVSDAPLHLKDQAVQTEVISYLAVHSDFDTSHDIPQESRELLKQLGAQEQSQGLKHSSAQLQEQESLQQLSRTNEAIQGLHRKVAELQQQLCWQVQDMENLQAELAQARQESTKQAEKIAAYNTHRQQLHREMRRMQTFREQSKQEVRMSQVFL
ncbi:putative uncharacterized protein DDB_G0271606 [Motacilla alba alba]|uniref:putative uncharacterized protein DDB_G0271606 n=1 Tax=Motacilla alba alba TaxID=1094192 RepID=UPI0018D52934|nr:putative uncharacterized protein DDB_G0271606 [Motacilla alba alba]